MRRLSRDPAFDRAYKLGRQTARAPQEQTREVAGQINVDLLQSRTQRELN
jgi:hypothetical protein